MKTPGRSTAAALLLLFAFVAVTLAAIIVPGVMRWTRDGQVIRDNRAKIEAIETSQQSFVRIKTTTDLWTGFSRGQNAGFLEASTSDEAMAAARTHITTLIEQNSGTLNSFDAIIGDVKRTQVEIVLLSLDAKLPSDRLAPFLTALEDAPPFTLVSGFALSRRDPKFVRLKLDGQMQRLMERSE
jgi:hypothetical protein